MAEDERQTCREHCELVVRLAEWRLGTDERLVKMDKQIEAFCEGTRRLKTAAWIVLVIVLAEGQGAALLQIARQLLLK